MVSLFYVTSRFFSLVQHDIHPRLKTFWFIVWTFISPTVMFIIFWGSVANELVKPLTYSQFSFNGEEVSESISCIIIYSIPLFY